MIIKNVCIATRVINTVIYCRGEHVYEVLATDTDGTKMLVRFSGDSEPLFELALTVRAGGRLLVVVLRKAGEYIMEKEGCRYIGTEPFIYQKKHSFRTIIEYQYGGLGSPCVDKFPGKEMIILCKWLLDEFNNKDARGVSRIPFKYHLDVDRPLLARVESKEIGVASIVFNRTEPPAITGEEEVVQLEYDISLADRVINEFYALNNEINIEAWSDFRSIQTNRVAALNNTGINNNENNNTSDDNIGGSSINGDWVNSILSVRDELDIVNSYYNNLEDFDIDSNNLFSHMDELEGFSDSE